MGNVPAFQCAIDPFIAPIAIHIHVTEKVNCIHEPPPDHVTVKPSNAKEIDHQEIDVVIQFMPCAIV
jgi:hypothetical protein